jgi:hypothetical protein
MLLFFLVEGIALLLFIFCGTKIWSISKPSYHTKGFSSFVVASLAMGVRKIMDDLGAGQPVSY